jgi:hypothetical protein
MKGVNLWGVDSKYGRSGVEFCVRATNRGTRGDGPGSLHTPPLSLCECIAYVLSRSVQRNATHALHLMLDTP